jgi:hypothetical protein
LLILTLVGFARPFIGNLMNTSARPAHPQLLLAIFLSIIAATFIFPRQIEFAGGWLLDLASFSFMDSKRKKEKKP